MVWLTDWGKHKGLFEGLSSIGAYVYRTTAYGFEQIGAIPRLLSSMAHHAPTRSVVSHWLRITAEDVIPLVLVTYGSECLQRAAVEYRDSETEQPHAPSAVIMINMGISLLQVATWVYSVRKKTDLFIRATVITLEAPSKLHGAVTRLPMTVCAEDCSALRFAQGSLRDIVAYWSTEALLPMLGYLPLVGYPLVLTLSTYHRGRYILTVVLPELCHRHQVIYLSNHSELAWSLGLGHAISSSLLTMVIERATGIPHVLYESAVDQWMLLSQMSMAAHMTLPDAAKQSHLALYDPLLMYQSGIGFVFDVLLLGLKIKIPRMLKGQANGSWKEYLFELPWSLLFRTIHRFLNNPVSHVLLPKLLRDKQAFFQDPIIASNWQNLQKTLIDTLIIILSLREKLIVKVSKTAPHMASVVVETLFGTPPWLTKLLLEWVTDEAMMTQLKRAKGFIEMVSLNQEVTPIRIHEGFLLTGQHGVSEVISTNTVFPSDHPADVSDVIRGVQSTRISPAIDARQIIRVTPSEAVSIGPNPGSVIRSRFFSQALLKQKSVDEQDGDWEHVDARSSSFK